MLEAISIGPFLIPTRPFSVVVSLLIAVWACGQIAQRIGLEKGWVRTTSERAVWIGLIGARVGYVIANWRAFADTPWTALYFWQPGYSAYTGIALGAAYVFWQANRRGASERSRYLLALAGGYTLASALVFSTALAMELYRDPGTLGKGDPVTDFTLQNLAGDTVSFSELAGRAVILNFWATWCPPCRREMPALNTVHLKYASQGVTIVGVDVGESHDTVQRFVEQMEVTYPIWLNAGAFARDFDNSSDVYKRFGGVGLPTTFFIDAGGVIRWIHVGELNRAFLENWAEALKPG